MDIYKLRKSANDAYVTYVRNRPKAIGESVQQVNAMWYYFANGRPRFSHMATEAEKRASALAAELELWKPKVPVISIPNDLRER